jgi:fumarylacetoacetate (FAA) hydrolase family protein
MRRHFTQNDPPRKQGGAMQVSSSHLPVDFAEGHFCARIMRPEGPCVIGFARGAAYDLTPAFGTASRFLEEDDAIGAITRRGQPVARMVREHPQSAGSPDWVSRLRALHGDHQGPEGSAVALMRELRDQEP